MLIAIVRASGWCRKADQILTEFISALNRKMQDVKWHENENVRQENAYMFHAHFGVDVVSIFGCSPTMRRKNNITLFLHIEPMREICQGCGFHFDCASTSFVVCWCRRFPFRISFNSLSRPPISFRFFRCIHNATAPILCVQRKTNRWREKRMSEGKLFLCCCCHWIFPFLCIVHASDQVEFFPSPLFFSVCECNFQQQLQWHYENSSFWFCAIIDFSSRKTSFILVSTLEREFLSFPCILSAVNSEIVFQVFMYEKCRKKRNLNLHSHYSDSDSSLIAY